MRSELLWYHNLIWSLNGLIQVESVRLRKWRPCYGSLNVYTFFWLTRYSVRALKAKISKFSPKIFEMHFRELSFFSSRGGAVETGWKTLLNFLSPLETAEKLLIPPLYLWKFHVTPPLLKPPPPKVCWVYNDVVPTCKGHCPCQLEVWGCCKVPRAVP